jgi:hypothetical protein
VEAGELQVDVGDGGGGDDLADARFAFRACLRPWMGTGSTV